MLFVKSRTAYAGVNEFIVGVLVRGVHHGGEIFATAVARIDATGDEELIEGFAIEPEALGLIENGRLPGDAEPVEVFEDSFGEV